MSTLVFKNGKKNIPTRLNIVIRGYRVSVGVMFAQRRRQWPSITSALGQCIVLSGVSGTGLESITRIVTPMQKHGTITQCCFNVGPTSKKIVGQNLNSIV